MISKLIGLVVGTGVLVAAGVTGYLNLFFDFIYTLLTLLPQPFEGITLVFLPIIIALYCWKLYKGSG